MVPEQNGTIIPNKTLRDLVPTGRVRGTGQWEDIGGGLQATGGPGTYRRPASRGTVGLDALALKKGGAGEIEMAGGVPTGRIIATGTNAAREAGQFVSTPIQIIRGLRSSYASGPSGMEWVSLERAARAARGDYMPSVREEEHQNRLEEIAACGEAQEAAGGLATLARKGATDYLTQMMLQGYGVADPADKTGQTKILPDYARAAILKVLPQVKTMEDVPKFLEKMGPELQVGKQVALFNNPATRETARAKVLNGYRQDMAAAGRAPDPNMEAVILKGQVTPGNVSFFNQAYNRNLACPGTLADLVRRKAATVERPERFPQELLSSGIAPSELGESVPLQTVYNFLSKRSEETGKKFQEAYESDLKTAAMAKGEGKPQNETNPLKRAARVRQREGA